MLHRPASPKPGPLSSRAGSGHVPITAARRSAGRSRTWCTTDFSTRRDKWALPNSLPATELHHKPISALRRSFSPWSISRGLKTEYPHNPTETSCQELANGLPTSVGSHILPDREQEVLRATSRRGRIVKATRHLTTWFSSSPDLGIRNKGFGLVRRLRTLKARTDSQRWPLILCPGVVAYPQRFVAESRRPETPADTNDFWDRS